MKNKTLAAPQKTASEHIPLDLVAQKRSQPELARALDSAGCPLHQISHAMVFLRNFICCLHLEPSFEQALWLATCWQRDVLRPNRLATLKRSVLPKLAPAAHENR